MAQITFAATPAGHWWPELKAKREQLPGAHQEFEFVSRASSGEQNGKGYIVLDLLASQWKEVCHCIGATTVRIFDGQDLFTMEVGGEEFTRVRQPKLAVDQVPAPYLLDDADWSQAIEVKRAPCGMATKDHECVFIDFPVKATSQILRGHNRSQILGGSGRLSIDTETGLLISLRIIKKAVTPRRETYTDLTFRAVKLSYGTAPSESLFRFALPFREVKKLPDGTPSQIKEALEGKPVPDFTVNVLEGKSLTLSALRGRVVLLRFWGTFCKSCNADSAALDKIAQKYGDQLVILSIAVSEERAPIVAVLKKHPASYSTILMVENPLPSFLQVKRIPFHLVIDRQGNVAAVDHREQGTDGFRKLLKKRASNSLLEWNREAVRIC